MNIVRGLTNMERILKRSGIGNDSDEYLNFAGWERQLRDSIENERKFAILDPQEQKRREVVMRELDRLALRLSGKSFLDLCMNDLAWVPQQEAIYPKPATADESQVKAPATGDKLVKAAYPERRLSVFLCHASEDKPAVRALYRRLTDDGVDPWLDEEKLLPGQDWHEGISRALEATDVVLVCLSQRSINKKGYVQKEIRDALDIADQQPQNMIFIIPLKLEQCEIPDRLRRWQWVNFFDERGYERLLNALKVRAKEPEDIPV